MIYFKTLSPEKKPDVDLVTCGNSHLYVNRKYYRRCLSPSHLSV